MGESALRRIWRRRRRAAPARELKLAGRLKRRRRTVLHQALWRRLGSLRGGGHWEVERAGEGEQGSSEEQLQASGGVDSFYRWTQGAKFHEECPEEAMQELWMEKKWQHERLH